jgi:hypothetical protein
MKTIFWIVLSLCITAWSGLCWVAYQVIGVGGRYAARNADALGSDADVVDEVSNWALWGTSFGEWAVIGVWGLGVVLALALGALANRLLGQRNNSNPQLEDQPPPRAT